MPVLRKGTSAATNVSRPMPASSLTPAAPVLAPPRTAMVDIRAMATSAANWASAHWLQIALATAAAVAIFAAFRLAKSWGTYICKKGAGTATWYGIAGRVLSRTGNVFIAATAARIVIGYADAPSAIRTTIIFLFTIAAVFQAAIWVRETIFGAVEHRTRESDAQARALASAGGIIRLLVTIALFAVAVVVTLGNLGVNVSGLIAGLGVGGIAIGLAAQGIFADLFAALAIIFDRPFRVGDSISYDRGSGSGTVETIGLKSTRIRGSNGEERILANRKLLDFEILNTTRRASNRFKFDFFLGYATPPELVTQIPALLKDAVESEGYTLIHGGLNGFAENGLSYDVEFESIEPDFPAEARDRVAAAILARFATHDVSFAYPTVVNLIAEKTKPSPPAGLHT